MRELYILWLFGRQSAFVEAPRKTCCIEMHVYQIVLHSTLAIGRFLFILAEMNVYQAFA